MKSDEIRTRPDIKITILDIKKANSGGTVQILWRQFNHTNMKDRIGSKEWKQKKLGFVLQYRNHIGGFWNIK